VPAGTMNSTVFVGSQATAATGTLDIARLAPAVRARPTAVLLILVIAAS
jgi:hypothetical protein